MSENEEPPLLVQGPPSLGMFQTADEQYYSTHEIPANKDRVSISIITGYLGSGKSTMLSHLSKQKEKKIAVILNEFGESADIEKFLTINQDGQIFEEWIELENGCLCCTVKDSGVVAIEKLMEKKGKFDVILLETTGIADPGPIANMFWLDSALASSIYLDGIITVLDAVNIIKSLNDTNESQSHDLKPLSTASIQIAHADILILNKIDKISSQQDLEFIKKEIRCINAIAPIIETTFGQVSLDSIINLKAYDEKVNIGNVHSYDNGWHDHRINTVSFCFLPISSQQFKKIEAYIQQALWDNDLLGTSVEIYRLKGKLINNETGKVTVVQGVREIYDFIDTEQKYPLQAKNEYPCKLVFIGKNFTKKLIMESFIHFTNISDIK